LNTRPLGGAWGVKLCGKGMEKEGFIMKTSDILISKSLKGFIKGSLVLTGFSFVLSFGVAALLICLNENIGCNVFALICFLIILPLIIFLIVFFRFSCLAKCYYEKMYIPSCIKHEYITCKIREEIDRQMNKEKENILETQKNEETLLNRCKIEVMGDVCLAVAKALKPDLRINEDELQKLVKEMFEQFSKIN